MFESNYEALQTSKDCAGAIHYTFDGQAGKLACEPKVCSAIKIAGKTWMSGVYKMETQGDWEHGVDGSPVYAKAAGKSFLYLFKQGPTWRVRRVPPRAAVCRRGWRADGVRRLRRPRPRAAFALPGRRATSRGGGTSTVRAAALRSPHCLRGC